MCSKSKTQDSPTILDISFRWTYYSIDLILPYFFLSFFRNRDRAKSKQFAEILALGEEGFRYFSFNSVMFILHEKIFCLIDVEIKSQLNFKSW